eukprot:1284785-Alexandrium_andersonii.AAC.1
MAGKDQCWIGALGSGLPALRYHEDRSTRALTRPPTVSLEPGCRGHARPGALSTNQASEMPLGAGLSTVSGQK